MSDYLRNLLARNLVTHHPMSEELLQPRLAGLYEPDPAEGSLLSSTGRWGEVGRGEASPLETVLWLKTQSKLSTPPSPESPISHTGSAAPETGPQPAGSLNPPKAPLEAPNFSFPSSADPASPGRRWASEVRRRNQEVQVSNRLKEQAEHPGQSILPSVEAAGSGEPDEQAGQNMPATPPPTGKQPHLRPRPLPSLLPEQGKESPPIPAQAANANQPEARQPATAVREADPIGTLRAPLAAIGLNLRSLRLGQAVKQEQAIHITIGRIEIRATQPSSHKEKAKPPSPPLLSLDEYLRQRSGGDRQP